MEELKQNRIIPQRVLKRYGSALLECVRKGIASDETYAISNPQNKDLAKSIRMWNYVLARQNNIHPELLLERQIVLNISENGLDGYRDGVEDLCHDELQKYLEGTSVIQQTLQEREFLIFR